MAGLYDPSLTTFVGRDEDVEAVAALLEGHRFVTITGPGGLGKTTLAGEVLRRGDLAATVIDLGSINDDSEVAALVARTLRVAEQSNRPAEEQLVRHIDGHELLLYLDNCEHVRDGVRTLVAALLRACPRLVVLATSTVRLDVPGEYLYELAPLTVPDDAGDIAALMGTASVRLLVDRTRQLVPHFEVTESNKEAVRRLSQRLDGIPLAIELAAPRLRVLSVADLVDRLDDRFAVLTGGGPHVPERHRTLRALVDWSYERCTDEERMLWARLAVFPGSFRLQAAEAVAGFGELAPGRVLDVLTGLVERSVVLVQRNGDRIRFRQLSTMRDYGAGLLRDRGEADEARGHLLDFVLTRTREDAGNWCGPHQAEFLEVWRMEHATMLAAFDWAIARPDRVAAAAELLVLLRHHWIAGGHLSDGRRWLDRILGIDGLSPNRRGHVLAVAAWVCLIQGDRGIAAGYLREAQDLAGAAGDAVLQAYVDSYSGLLALFEGRLKDAVDRYRVCIPVFLEAGEQAAAQTAMFQLAMAQTYLGRTEEALETCREEMAIGLPRGELWDRAYAEWVTSICHWHAGRLDLGEQAARQALVIQESFEDGICIALVLLVVCWIRQRQGRHAEAVRAARAAEVVWELLGTGVEAFGPDFARECERWVPSTAEDGADGAGADGAEAEQLPATKAGAVQCGLEILGADRAAEPAARTVPELTQRENEVFAHLMQGHSNRAIADTLVVSPRTVEGHVQRILTKLDLSSRAEVPAWYARHHGGATPRAT
ncbi:Predicted ATPase [Raineyella antarctica]|uniref:Predicted ATPase n=1 Tax=Raineyella antarctica TaxID=1577474 RepID=A0A1G6I571_9ACTN|nr:LuxR C-terminal-related transcriptional regulator [Raineyella antarctica]SDC01523.1 Predicted ATPase [Raineyella antarctica]